MPKRFDGLSDSSNLLRVYDTTFIREEPFGKSSGKTTRTTTTISSSLWKDFFLVLSATITTYLTKDFFFGLLNSLFLIQSRLENFKKSRLKKLVKSNVSISWTIFPLRIQKKTLNKYRPRIFKFPGLLCFYFFLQER